MATFNKFQDFVEQLGKGVHNFSSHIINVYLSNEQPLVGDTIKTDIAGITEQNGYAAASITPVWSETGGTATLVGTDVEWTASGAGFGPFQFAIIYNESATNPLDALICWWEYTSSISCAAGEKFKVDFGASILTIA